MEWLCVTETYHPTLGLQTLVMHYRYYLTRLHSPVLLMVEFTNWHGRVRWCGRITVCIFTSLHAHTRHTELNLTCFTWYFLHSPLVCGSIEGLVHADHALSHVALITSIPHVDQGVLCLSTPVAATHLFTVHCTAVHVHSEFEQRVTAVRPVVRIRDNDVLLKCHYRLMLIVHVRNLPWHTTRPFQPHKPDPARSFGLLCHSLNGDL